MTDFGALVLGVCSNHCFEFQNPRILFLPIEVFILFYGF